MYFKIECYNIIYCIKSLFLCLELQASQILLMIEKKASLAKTQQITDLKEKLKLTSTLSSGLYQYIYHIY